MRILVGDIEANGFVGVADRVHCCVLKDINTNEI